MTEPTLSFAELLEHLQQGISSMSDPRKASNATTYSLSDAVLGAFAMFFMQCESFLEHQRQMQSRWGKNNAQTLFGLTQVPTNNQIKNILDAIPPRRCSVSSVGCLNAYSGWAFSTRMSA